MEQELWAWSYRPTSVTDPTNTLPVVREQIPQLGLKIPRRAEADVQADLRSQFCNLDVEQVNTGKIV